MSRTHLPQFSIWRMLALATIFFCLKLQHAAAQAITIPQQTTVGSSAAPLQVTLTLPNGGTINSVKLLGQGTPNVDFMNNGGTCAPNANILPGNSCNLSIIFSPSSPGERRGAVVLLDSNNKVLASQLLVGQAVGSVGVFVPGIINTVAGDSTWVYDGDGRAAIDSAVFLPFGIAVDAAGDLFIADSSNNRIRRVDAKSGAISTFAGSGIIGSTGDGGLAVNATLNNPTSVALDPAGNLFFADAGNNVVRRVDAFSGLISTVAGTIGQHGYTGDTGPANTATFNTPNGISFDANGNLYIADTGNHVIRLVNTSGIITTVAGTGTPGFNGDNQPAIKAQLNSPWSATPIAGGGFYIADQQNSRIRRVDASGNITTTAGSTAGFAGDNGPATQAQLDQPAGVLVDVAGNIYIADSGNNRVRRINPTTGVITTFAGNGSESFSGDAGPADQAGVYGPYAFALDSQGNLYIADVFHNRIRQVAANTASLTFPVMRVDRISTPLTQALENDGNAPLNVSSFAAVSNSQLDAGTTTCSTSAPLAPLAQCVVGVDFAPLTTGQTVNGSLNVVSNAGNSPGVIDLQGQVLDVDPTATTLTSSANPATTGTPIVFSIAVASAGTTPTGTVTLLDGTSIVGTAPLQEGGVATLTISTLAHGSHALTASYAGDSENATSVSAVLTEVVKDQEAATTTSLVSALSPSTAGAPTSFTATVSVVTANSGVGAIGGTVALKQGLNTLGVGNINTATANGSTATANISVTNLPVGADSLIAVYSGNSSYAGSSSAPLIQNVQLAVSKVTLASEASPSTAGVPLGLTATLTSNGAAPTGNVTFMDGATTLGIASINAQGVALLSAPGKFWTVGSHTLTAVYAGDSNNAPSNSLPLLQQVNIASTSISIASSLNPAGSGAAITFTAAVNGNGGTPTGSVQFFDGANSLGSAPLNVSTPAIAAINTSGLAVGPHQITAVYSGDPLDAVATSTPITETIQTATISVKLQSSANPVIFNAPLTLSVQVSGSGSTPTGTVTLLDGSNAIATAPVPATGVIAFTNPSLQIGTHALTAAYSGDVNHSASNSATLTQTVQQATTTSLTPSASTLVAGKPLSLNAVVTGVSNRPVTGTIVFKDGGATIASIAPNANGVAAFTSTTLAPGTHVLIASYSGDTLDAASASNSNTVSVTIASTSTSFTTNANPINSGSALTLTSAVTGNGGIPTGSVAFMDGGSVISSVEVTPSGTASLTLSTLAPGIHQLSAHYSGDTLDGASISPTIAQQIAQKTAVTITSSANPSLLQDTVTLTINVSNGAPTAIPTGSVTLSDGGVTLTNLILNSAGNASYSWQAPALGAHTLVASYAGDNANSPASSSPLTQNVTLRPSTVSFISSTSALSLGQQITLISVVQADGSRPASGTVTWISGSTTLGSATIDATGLATATVTPPQGVFNAVAQYSGDSLYAPSDSSPSLITVGPPIEFVIGVTPPNMSVSSGSHSTIGINITTAQTFTDTLALGCSGLPQFATCTFSENQIAVSGGQPHSLQVTVDTGTPLGAGPSARLNTPVHSGLSNTFACALPAGAFLALLLGLNRRKLHKLDGKLVLFSMLLLLGVGSTVLSGCASSFSQSATAAGNYTFQIVAAGNKTLVTQTATVQLTVTK